MQFVRENLMCSSDDPSPKHEADRRKQINTVFMHLADDLIVVSDSNPPVGDGAVVGGVAILPACRTGLGRRCCFTGEQPH